MHVDHNHNSERDLPVSELVRRLSDEATTLVRKEIELAKAEMADKARKAERAPACSAEPRRRG